MTTLPTTRPSIPVTARPTPASGATIAPTLPAIDPIRLFKKYKWLLIGAAVAGVVLGGVGHLILRSTYPIYRPYIVYECLPLRDNPAALVSTANFEKDLEKFMATQVQVLTSEKIIDRTVTDPALKREAPRWVQANSRGGAIDTVRAAKAVKRRLAASIVGDSNFIRVSFWGNNKEETTAVLKILGETYLTDRRTAGRSEVSERREQINQAIKNTEDETKKLQNEKESILQNNKIESLEEQSSAASQELRSIEEALVQVRTSRESAATQHKQLQDEVRSPNGPTVPDNIRKRVEENPTLVQLRHYINQINSELSAKQMQGLKQDHPTMQKLQSLKDGSEKRYQEEQQRLLIEAFYAELESLKTAVASLEAQEARLQGRREEAMKRASELAQLLTRVKDISQSIERNTENKGKLMHDLSTMDIVTSGTSQSRVTLFQNAQVPKAPSFPKLLIMVPLGMILVLGLVGGTVVLIEIVDQRVKGPADVSSLPRTRVLGLIPHSCEDPQNCERIETVFRDRPAGILSEHFRQIRSQVLKRLAQGGHKSLLIVAPSPGSGATTVAINLAFAIGATDQRVLLIDANFRRPTVHKTLGLSEGPGLADVLDGSSTMAAAVQHSGSVAVITAGTADRRVVERLATEPMSTLLKDAGAAYDVIIVDTAPTMVAGDAMTLANRCDSVLMVARAMADKRGMVARLRNDLAETKADLVGIVVNAARTTAGGYLKGNIESAHRYQNGSGKA
jgi:succinoglycan biosynthesis transport protein ExoP